MTDPVETPLTDEQVAAEWWRLFDLGSWDDVRPDIQRQLVAQVMGVRRALASLESKTPPTQPNITGQPGKIWQTTPVVENPKRLPKNTP